MFGRVTELFPIFCGHIHFYCLFAITQSRGFIFTTLRIFSARTDTHITIKVDTTSI